MYDDLCDKLIAKGIPAEEIAYVHSANTEAKKKELFGKVRSGQIRVLIGSTQKMGGTLVGCILPYLKHVVGAGVYFAGFAVGEQGVGEPESSCSQGRLSHDLPETL